MGEEKEVRRMEAMGSRVKNEMELKAGEKRREKGERSQKQCERME